MKEQDLVAVGPNPFGGSWKIVTPSGDSLHAGEMFCLYAVGCVAKNRAAFLSCAPFVAGGKAQNVSIGSTDAEGNFGWFGTASSAGPINGLMIESQGFMRPDVLQLAVAQPVQVAPITAGIPALAHAIATKAIDFGWQNCLGYPGTQTSAPIYFMQGPRPGPFPLPFTACADDVSSSTVAKLLGGTVTKEPPPEAQFTASEVIGPLPLVNWINLGTQKCLASSLVLMSGSDETDLQRRINDALNGK